MILADYDANTHLYSNWVNVEDTDLETAILMSVHGYQTVSEDELIHQALYDAEGVQRIRSIEDIQDLSMCDPDASERQAVACRRAIATFKGLRNESPDADIYIQDGALFTPDEVDLSDFWEEDQVTIRTVPQAVKQAIKNEPLQPGERIESIKTSCWGIYDGMQCGTSVKTNRRSLSFIFDARETHAIEKAVKVGDQQYESAEEERWRTG